MTCISLLRHAITLTLKIVPLSYSIVRSSLKYPHCIFFYLKSNWKRITTLLYGKFHSSGFLFLSFYFLIEAGRSEEAYTTLEPPRSGRLTKKDVVFSYSNHSQAVFSPPMWNYAPVRENQEKHTSAKEEKRKIEEKVKLEVQEQEKVKQTAWKRRNWEIEDK